MLDLNPANVGKVRYGIEVEYGILAYDEVVKNGLTSCCAPEYNIMEQL